MVLYPKVSERTFLSILLKQHFTSSNKITYETLGFFNIDSTSIYCSNVILMLKQRQISCLLVKVEVILFPFFLFFFFDETNVFLWLKNSNRYVRQKLFCRLSFCIEQFERGQVNNK